LSFSTYCGTVMPAFCASAASWACIWRICSGEGCWPGWSGGKGPPCGGGGCAILCIVCQEVKGKECMKGSEAKAFADYLCSNISPAVKTELYWLLPQALYAAKSSFGILRSRTRNNALPASSLSALQLRPDTIAPPSISDTSSEADDLTH
jgi:hypothetical protein